MTEKVFFFGVFVSHSYFAIMPPDLLHDKGFTYGEKMVYLAVSARANSTKDMWASNRRIGEDIGMSMQRVSKAIQKLVSKGYLKIEYDNSVRHILTLAVEGKGLAVEGKGGSPPRAKGLAVEGKHKNIKEEVKVKNNIYGEFKHVKLTSDEYNRLLSEWGIAELDFRIKELDEYIELKGAKYKNHNLAIRRFKRNNYTSLQPTSSPSSPIRIGHCRKCGRDNVKIIDNICVGGCPDE